MPHPLLGPVLYPKQRPRAALETLSTTLDAELFEFFPHAEVIHETTRTHHEDFDVLVTQANEVGRQGLFCVAFGSRVVRNLRPLVGEEPTNDPRGLVLGPRYLVRSTEIAGRTLRGVPDLHPAIDRLVRTNLAREFEQHWSDTSGLVVRGFEEMTNANVLDPNPERYLDPIAMSSDGHVVAGRVRIATTDGLAATEAWVLPGWVSDKSAWVQAACEIWRSLDPERFPLAEGEDGSDLWLTPEEIRIRAEVEDLNARKERFDRAVERRMAPLAESLEDAARQADLGPRRLLTTKDDALVEAVSGALVDLGFEVDNMDEKHPAGDKREDLRVRYGDFEALAEVKGTTRGASSGRLLQLGNHAMRYAVETGRAPSAQWYVVNPQHDRQPSQRELPLQSKPEELQAFGQAGGLVVWTLDLFRLWQRVMTRELSADEGRSLLMESQGRLTLPE